MKLVPTTLILMAVLGLGSASAAQQSTAMTGGKKCQILFGGGVQCPREGPKCIAPCRADTARKPDDRPLCESTAATC